MARHWWRRRDPGWQWPMDAMRRSRPCTSPTSARGEELRHDWDAAQVGVPLVILDSPVRSFDGALLRYLDFVQKREDPHCFLTVILPELLPTRWWHPLVHNYFAWRLKWVLMFRPRTAVTSVPYEVRE